MFLLLIPLLVIMVYGVGNGLIMLFVGNVHAANPDLLPALGYGDTFLLMLPLYLLSLALGIFVNN